MARKKISDEDPRTVAGAVSGAGAITSSVPSGAFTVNRTGVGTYVITFTTAFSAVPVVSTGLGIANANKITRLTTKAAGSFTVNVRESVATANSFDEPFEFVAVGPS